jgi:TetR/AcrR family transcriptional repressor of nem operon
MGRTSNARQLLLNAACDLLWEKSYHSVTVDDICARAGVRKGSLYHFFDSKSAVAVAALEHFGKRSRSQPTKSIFPNRIRR